MEQNLKEQRVVHPCIQCGYCCKKSPCSYADKKGEHCRFLQVADAELGTYKCLIRKEIKEIEKDERWPMFDCGCSSPLFNTIRNNVIRKQKRKLRKRDRL